MPQVQRERDVGEEAQWRDFQQAARTPPRVRRRPEDHQQGAADGPERPRAGEQGDAVEHEAGGDDQGEPEPAEHGAQGAGGLRPAEEQGQGRTEAELPEPGARVEVGERLVDGAYADREPEGRGRREDHEHGQRRPEPAARDDGQEEHERRPEEHELPLHRQRPEVLQRARRRARCPVRELRVDHLPVQQVDRRGPDLAQRALPHRLRQDQHHDGRRRRQHHERGGSEPGERAPVVLGQAQVPTLRTADQRPGHEEARQGQEDVDAARDPAVAEEVEEDDEDQGQPAQTVDLGDAPRPGDGF